MSRSSRGESILEKNIKGQQKNVMQGFVTTIPVFLGSSVVRFLLGYRNILFVDLVFIVLFILSVMIYWLFGKSTIMFKVTKYLFIFFFVIFMILPGFEYKGAGTTFLIELTYLLPTIIFLINHYIKKRKKIKPKSYKKD